MAKEKKLKKPGIKSKKGIYIIIISCVLVLLLLLISGLIYKKLSTKEDKNTGNTSDENFSFYDEDKCRCIERERLKCLEGFELDLENRLCRKGNEITNVILGCSEYECSGVVYEFNSENKIWERK